ncbi:MAG TPA: OmpA family protein, partial [Polyangia bacterium]|nr:OmpA family protein [Polyangia bacterium]
MPRRSSARPSRRPWSIISEKKAGHDLPILFDSGKTDIKADGQAALAQVAQVLATIPDRNFIVAGNTDKVPIHTARFPSNWELSTARAVEVTKFLIA